MESETIDVLRRRHPNLVGTLDLLVALDDEVAQFGYEPFREPVSLIEAGDKGHGSLINIDKASLESWTNHMAYAMRVRMRSAEPGILRELAAGRLLTAQVLMRMHFEATALAALCVETLQDSKGDDDWAAVRELIPKTLFGTGLYTKTKKSERLSEYLTFAEQRTIVIGHAVDALDAFVFKDHADGEMTVLYGLLCEAAHPNQRGVKGFITSEEIGELGWNIQYNPVESIDDVFLQKLLETLLFTMRYGHAATVLLQSAEFQDTEDGARYLGIPPEALRYVWEDILQRPPSGGAT